MDPTPSRAARAAYVLLTALFWVVLVAGVIVVAHRLFGLGQDPSVLTVPASVSVEDVHLPEGFEIAGPLPVDVDIAGPTTTQRVLASVPPSVWWALALTVLWLVRAIARSAARGEPFQASNVKRLRWLGGLFLLGFPVATIVERVFTDRLFSAGVWSDRPLPEGGVVVGIPMVSAPAIMAAVSLFALAEVFAHGMRLREDVDATI